MCHSAHPLVAIMRLSLKRLKFQVSQAQLSGVQECRSDASLRSVDDSVACIVETIFYTSTLLQLLYLRNLNKYHSSVPKIMFLKGEEWYFSFMEIPSPSFINRE